jgi:hypothetical protein
MAALKRKAQEIRNEVQEIKKKPAEEGGPSAGLGS